MPKARLRLTIPEQVWIGELTRQYPETTVRILAALSDEETGVGLAEIEGPALQAFLAEMEAYDDVTDCNVLSEPGDHALVQFETTLPLLLLPARDSGVPLEMPFELKGGRAVWDVTASSDRLSELASQLRVFDIQFRIEHLHHDIDRTELLTETQTELVETAIRLGYYDTPRECSLTELADTLDIAKSTASETLHRAEEKIIKEFADTIDLDTDPDVHEPRPVSPARTD